MMPDTTNKSAAERLSGYVAQNKIVSAEEAVALIRDGDSIAIEGFAGQCFAEELTSALESRFVDSGGPKDLSIVFAVAQGDRQGRGFDRLCHPGLLASAIGGHWGMSAELQKLAVENEIEAYNLPQGVIAQLFRDTAAGKPGLLTRVGLGTFVDPRNGGGKINSRTTTDRVSVMEIDGEEYLFYRTFDLNVAFLRGTTADADGNTTLEHEALTLETLAVATAVHNAGGLVIMQVERTAARGTLSPRDVVVPAALVDCVVVSEPDHHWQTLGTRYSPQFSGELRAPVQELESLEMDSRKIIARRAALNLRPGSVVNLGIGLPEGIARVAAEEQMLEYLTLTAEPGCIGGRPMGGLDFGSAINPQAILDQPAQFDFYDGGGLDAAFLGMAQADAGGNVNVSRFGSKLAGSGGFINISQNAKELVFCGTFTVPSRCSVIDGRLEVEPGDVAPKFVAEVEQRTFSGEFAAERGQPVLYVTERAVLRLGTRGLELIEIAPGLDLERDVLAHMGFTPIMESDPELMDTRIFAEGRMDLATDLLSIPLEARFSYDREQNTFFLNMGGMSLTSLEDISTIRGEVEHRLNALGQRAHMAVNYDNFYVAPRFAAAYSATVKSLADQYYLSVTRYTTSSFLRLKLGGDLAGRGIAPNVYETRQEALRGLDTKNQL